MTEPVVSPFWQRILQHACHYEPVHSFQRDLRSEHQLVSRVAVFPEDVCALYYSASFIMAPGFMSPSATFIASDILLLLLMDNNIPLNKPEQNLNWCRRWKRIYVYFDFHLRVYLFIFILDQLGTYVICGLHDVIAADVGRIQSFFFLVISWRNHGNLNYFKWKSYTVSWRTSGWKWAGHETSVEEQKDASRSSPYLHNWLFDKPVLVSVRHLKAQGTCVISITWTAYQKWAYL